jgi:L-rhamnose mutarotase
MKKFAFKMIMKPGMKEEYKKRHDAIWPELKKMIEDSGVITLFILMSKPMFFLQSSIFQEKVHRRIWEQLKL